MTIQRQLAAEGLGTAILAAMAIGSAMMAESLGGNPLTALLACSLVCGLGLFALLACFGNISGAHFNPVLTLSEVVRGQIAARLAAGYIAVQCIGAFSGVAAAHIMFNAPAFEAATIARSASGHWIGEFIAAFGLIGVCIGSTRHGDRIMPFAVAAYVVATFWFTPSSALLNPAMTFAKAMTASPAGIRLSDVPSLVTAQLCGGLASTLLFSWLYPNQKPEHSSGPASIVSDACLDTHGVRASLRR